MTTAMTETRTVKFKTTPSGFEGFQNPLAKPGCSDRYVITYEITDVPSDVTDAKVFQDFRGSALINPEKYSYAYRYEQIRDANGRIIL